MKKVIFAVAALLAAVTAQAQIGITAGLTSSSTTLETALTDVQGGNVNQYHVGISYKIGLGNLFAIQPAILYNVKGSNFDYSTITLDNVQLDFKTGFVEVPVQLQLGFGIGSLVRVYGFAEPFVGYAITNEVTWETGLGALGTAADRQSTWDGIKNRLEYGMGIGAGVEILKHVQVGVKYFWTLSDLYGIEDATADNILNGLGNLNMGNVNGVAASITLLF